MFILYIHVLAIGTAVTCAGESDVFAFTSVVPINDPGPLQPLLDSLKSSLQSHTSDSKSTHNTSLKTSSSTSSTSTPPLSLLDLLSHTTPPPSTSSSSSFTTTPSTSLPSKVEYKTGLLLTNKFTNLPLPLIAPLHKNLYDDILWIKSSQENYSDDTSKQLTENHVENWRDFEYLLLLLPIELTSPNKDIINSIFKQYNNMIPYTYIKNLPNNNHINIIYQYFEDEILAQNSGFRTESLSGTESSSPPSDSSTTTSSNMYIWRSSSTSSGGSSASSSGGGGGSGDSILKSNSIYMVSVIHINEYKKSIGEIETLIG